jgi:acyl carrier protein
LWFAFGAEGFRFYPSAESADLQDEVWNVLADYLGVDRQQLRSNPNALNEAGADSLVMVEVVMEIEEELGFP